MVFKNQLFSSVLLIGICKFYAVQNAEERVFSQVLYRHGDRTPTDDFPTNPYKENAWLNGFGQLTELGMQQQYNLGRWFRSYYQGLINTTYYDRYQVYVRSSDKDRTLSSAYANLAGLYPPRGQQIWNPNITWQPIPVHTIELERDSVLTVDVPCNKWQEMFTQVANSEQAKKLVENNKVNIDYVLEKSGWPKSTSTEETLANVWQTNNAITCMYHHPDQYPPPSWANEQIREFLDTFDWDRIRMFFPKPEMIRLNAGLMFHYLTDTMDDRISGKLDFRRKLHMYSTHDSMLSGIMIGMKVWDGKQPPQASALILDLYKNGEEYFVKLMYKNDTAINPTGDAHVLKLPDCDTLCPVHKFKELLEPYTYDGSMEDRVKECEEGIGSSGAVVALTLLLVIFSIAIVGICLWCRKKRKDDFTYSAANFNEPHVIRSNP